MGRILHSDKCRWWDDEEFCDCGAVEIARLESALAEEKKAREEAEAVISAISNALRGRYVDNPHITVSDASAVYLQAANANGRVAQLEEAIQRALDDEESGEGWGPDVTVCGYLRKALTSSPSAAAEVLRAAEELSSSVTVWDYGFIEFPKSAVNKVIEAVRKHKEGK